jgi:hypothetical protein
MTRSTSERQCKGCGGEIPPTRRSDAQYCTKECSSRIWRENNPQRIKELERQREPRDQREYQKEYREKNSEELNRKTRERRQIEAYGQVVTIPEMTKDRYRHAREHGYRSGLEVKIAKQLGDAGIGFKYEPFPITYQVPARTARYTADFVLHNGIVVETKGRWLTEDRKKIKLIAEQYPALDLRMVFSNSNAKIGKKSKTSYADYCRLIEIPYADKLIPQEWLDEPDSPVRWAAIEEFRWAGSARKRKAA